jgi:hypothetical protein
MIHNAPLDTQSPLGNEQGRTTEQLDKVFYDCGISPEKVKFLASNMVLAESEILDQGIDG